jgi:hypothetical protein
MPQKEAASSMKRPKETVCKSTDVSNPFLGFDFRRCNRLRRKLKHRRFLPFEQVGQQHHLAVRKIFRRRMAATPTRRPSRLPPAQTLAMRR